MLEGKVSLAKKGSGGGSFSTRQAPGGCRPHPDGQGGRRLFLPAVHTLSGTCDSCPTRDGRGAARRTAVSIRPFHPNTPHRPSPRPTPPFKPWCQQQLRSFPLTPFPPSARTAVGGDGVQDAAFNEGHASNMQATQRDRQSGQHSSSPAGSAPSPSLPTIS